MIDNDNVKTSNKKPAVNSKVFNLISIYHVTKEGIHFVKEKDKNSSIKLDERSSKDVKKNKQSNKNKVEEEEEDNRSDEEEEEKSSKKRKIDASKLNEKTQKIEKIKERKVISKK